MEHDFDEPDVVSYMDGVVPDELSPESAEPGDVPGGLYDDAVVIADAGLDDAVVFETAAALEDAMAFGGGAALDDGTGVDDGAVTAELDIDGSLLDTIEEELADVERALALLDEGTYGQCEHCSRTIDDDILARTPTARFCAEHLPLSLR